jgi:hypothetical protein
VSVYEEQWFLAEVAKDQSKVEKGYVNLSNMTIKRSNSFLWPIKPAFHLTLEEEIIMDSVAVEPINSRGHLGLKKKDFEKLQSLMVVLSLHSFLKSFFCHIYMILETHWLHNIIYLCLCYKKEKFYASQTRRESTTIFKAKNSN